jgi:hypothetical protein
MINKPPLQAAEHTGREESNLDRHLEEGNPEVASSRTTAILSFPRAVKRVPGAAGLM